VNWKLNKRSGCYAKVKKESLDEIAWFAEVTTFIVDPKALVRARESRGISQSKLAEMLGWSRTKLRRVESTVAEISKADCDLIQGALES
jgi:predicted transcriptional regulator